MRQELLHLHTGVNLVRLTISDCLQQTEDFGALRACISGSDSLYPGIEAWFDRKVTAGLASGERVAYVAYLGCNPVGAGIGKRGSTAKVCHLNLAPEQRMKNLGEMLFSLMLFDLKEGAEKIRFTLPEGLWEQKSDFFRSFGFDSVAKSGRQYRRGEGELACESSFDTVWNNLTKRLPNLLNQSSVSNFALDQSLVMSISPPYASAILSGAKRFEIRRKFSEKWVGRRATIYATKPSAALVGEVTIKSICHAKPSDIWSTLGVWLGCTSMEFQSYTKGCDKVYALELSDRRCYRTPVRISRVSEITGDSLRPPQSFCGTSNPIWERAVMVASLLGDREHLGVVP